MTVEPDSEKRSRAVPPPSGDGEDTMFFIAQLPVPVDEPPPASHGPLHPVAIWSRLRRDRPALVGLAMIAVFALVALAAPFISPARPEARDLDRMNEPPRWLAPAGETPEQRAAAARTTLAGRDVAGRDVLSRTLHGTRTSLLVGLAVATLAAAIGVTLGCLAGYRGGWTDAAIMRAVDILLAFPTLILALALVSIFPRTTVWHIALVLGLAGWPGICRLMRAQVMATRDLDYVKAALALGATHMQVLGRHVLPNCVAPVVIWFTMSIAGAVMSEASLSFLGLGDPDSLSWGTMINTGLFKANFPEEWWTVALPSTALAMLVLAFNLLGDGLQDAINPKLKR